MDLETQDERRFWLSAGREGRQTWAGPTSQTKTIHKYPKEPHGSSTVMKHMPPNAGADGEEQCTQTGHPLPYAEASGAEKCSARSLCTCSLEGWIRAKRCVRAALKGTPPMACRVLEGGRPNNQGSQVMSSKFTCPPSPAPHKSPSTRTVPHHITDVLRLPWE